MPEIGTSGSVGAPGAARGNPTAFSPDSARVITASEDNTARMWDACTGKLLTEPLAHQAPVTAAAFSPDGERVVTASTDHTARVWTRAPASC